MPVIMLLGIGAHSKEALTTRLAFILDLQTSMVTQMDLRTVLRQIQNDAAGEQNYQIRDLRQYIGTVLQSHSDRDVTVDGWGTPYRHQMNGPLITLTSAGADKTFGTSDDLVVSGNISVL